MLGVVAMVRDCGALGSGIFGGCALNMDVPQHGCLDVRAGENYSAGESAEACGGVRAMEDGRTSTSRRLRRRSGKQGRAETSTVRRVLPL